MKEAKCKAKAWLYEPDESGPKKEKCRCFINRYVLGEVEMDLSKLDNVLVCIGLNTSTARPRNLDPTLKRVQGFAERKGYKSWIMLNLYPQGATNPDDMHDPENKPAEKTEQKRLCKENLAQINGVLRGLNNPTILAAWGDPIEKRKFLGDNLRYIHKSNKSLKENWKQIGKLTSRGHPRHPSRVAYRLPFEPFDIEKYLKNF